MGRERVIVAMSGGVDSSVAAFLLKEAGYEVAGAYMRLWNIPGSAYQERYAEHMCYVLTIPFHIIDLQQEFEHYVVNHFCQEYKRGRTPNPCIACNQHIKFGFLFNKVLSLGFDYLATGHYARVERSEDSYLLMKANDRNKDQSYFLYTLSQERLSRLLFPLGKYSNAEVKQVAKERNLPVQNKPSQDLCFISGKNYRSFFVQHLSTEPGDIVDSSGETLGRHQGIAFYTIGQRRGLGTISGKPFYVIRIDSGNNQVVLGAEEELYSREAIAQKASWIAGTPPADFNGVTAKIRYRSTEVPVTVSLQEKSITIWFSQPQRAVTPGQAIVFYHGNEVLGGGIIENFLPVSPSKAAMNPVPVIRS